MNNRCYFCHINSFEKLLDKSKISEQKKNKAIHEFLGFLSKIPENITSPEIAKGTNAIICDILNNSDPYKPIKEIDNNFALSKINEFKEIIDNSENKFETALRLSIAGNIMDSISSPNADISKTIAHVLNSELAINHSNKLEAEIQKAKTILYLGDNAGEIVLDKLFIETINHDNIYFAVRGAPVINDATIEDAELVKMSEVAKVISNGDSSSSTLLNYVSDEFLDIYNKADVIISKGMGNLEGLLNNGNKKIFFLLMVKCTPIGESINAKKGDFVVLQNKSNFDIKNF